MKKIFILLIIFSLSMCNKKNEDNGISNSQLNIPIEVINDDILFKINIDEYVEDNGYLIFDESPIESELLGINEANLFVMDSEDNKFIGYLNLYI